MQEFLIRKKILIFETIIDFDTIQLLINLYDICHFCYKNVVSVMKHYKMLFILLNIPKNHAISNSQHCKVCILFTPMGWVTKVKFEIFK